VINRKQFIRAFAEKYHVTYRLSERMCKDIFEFLGETVYQNGEDVTIQGFGSFKHKQIQARRLRHPTSGEMMVVPARDVVKFTPSGSLLPDE